MPLQAITWDISEMHHHVELADGFKLTSRLCFQHWFVYTCVFFKHRDPNWNAFESTVGLLVNVNWEKRSSAWKALSQCGSSISFSKIFTERQTFRRCQSYFTTGFITAIARNVFFFPPHCALKPDAPLKERPGDERSSTEEEDNSHWLQTGETSPSERAGSERHL